MNLLCISHNAYWSDFMRFKEMNKNCEIDCFGSFNAVNPRRAINYDNYDAIVCFSPNYDNGWELEEMVKLAEQISKEKGKRVTVGFSCFIPPEERTKKDLFYKVEIVNVDGDKKQYETSKKEYNDFNVEIFLDEVIKKYNDNPKIKVKVKTK